MSEQSEPPSTEIMTQPEGPRLPPPKEISTRVEGMSHHPHDQISAKLDQVQHPSHFSSRHPSQLPLLKHTISANITAGKSQKTVMA
jgi:hypothetical protein